MPGSSWSDRFPAALLLIAGSACGLASSGTDQPDAPRPEPSASEAPRPPGNDSAAREEASGEASPRTPASPLAPAPAQCTSAAVGGDIIATTQASIDALAGCDTIHGSLTIQFSSATLDLRPLAGLRVIEGMLWVGPAYTSLAERLPIQLGSLRGLEQLSSVESLVLVGIESGLGPLSQLSGDVAELILDDVSGTRDLSALGGVRVTNSFSLNDMPELERLGRVGVAPQLATLSIWATPQLTSLAGLEGLVELGSLDLRDLASLRELALPDSLDAVTYVGIFGAGQLTTLAELARFSDLRALVVANSPVGDLGGSGASAGSLETLRVLSCPALTELDPVGGFSALTEVEIEDCDGLTEIDRIGESTAIQTLRIRKNAALTRLPVFERGPAQMVQVTVRDNAALVRGPSFPNLTELFYVETPYYESAELEFTNNPVLASMGDYPRLESITMLALNQQPALADFALPSLHSLRWLRVRDNESLARVELNLQEGPTIIEVTGNSRLEGLTLGPATGLLQRLELQGNPALASEDQQRLLDRVDASTQTLPN